MRVNFSIEGSKIQLLYVLWVLENFSDENNTLKQDDIVEILERKGYHTERKSVGRDLKLLLDFGYNIHGIEPELDKDGNELPLKRGKIWLERDFSDEQLSLLLNSVAHNVFIEKGNKEELLDNIISLGSKTFNENHKSRDILNGGNIYQVAGATLLNQLKDIERAINSEKKIRFKYASKLKRDGNSFVYEKDKEYVVSPYWIVSKNGNFYLVCYNHGENQIWNCRVDKIKEVTIIRSHATPRTDTELKGISVGDYVSKHPNMMDSKVTSVELKVARSKIGLVFETFNDVKVLQENETTINVQVACGELDMFYWAIQYGGIVEVLRPQKLRDEIRHHVESMVFKYQCGDGDKYTEAIRIARRTRVLDLQGIDLRQKPPIPQLSFVRSLYLSNNNISNLSLISSLPRLRSVSLSNLALKNIDELIDSDVLNLSLDLDKTVDLSAIAKIPHLITLTISEKCSYNLTIPWDYIEEKNIKFAIFDRDSELSTWEERNVRSFLNDYYPRNIFIEAFGLATDFVGEPIDILTAVEKLIEKFEGKERKYVELFYKTKLCNYKELRKALGVNVAELQMIESSVRSKLEHPSFNSLLEKFVKERGKDQGLRPLKDDGYKYRFEKLLKNFYKN